MRQRNQFGDFDLQSRLFESGWSIEGDYVNAHKKNIFVCPNGHRKLISWVALRLSFFCRECARDAEREEIKGWLSDTEWRIGSSAEGLYGMKCKEGHLFKPCKKAEIRKKLDRNPSCSECERKRRMASVVSIFEELGWSLMGEYKGYHIPVSCECPGGHKQMKRPSSLIAGKGCQKCAGLTRKSEVEVKKEFERFGWEITGKYVNTSVPVDCVCPNGHLVKKSLDCLRISPGGCVICSGQVPVHPLEKRQRRNERVKNWRKWTPLILGRDGCRCVVCGSIDDVQAHHLNSYHKYPAERYDLNNGVSLCVRHHGSPFNRVKGSFHMVYGFMNNTKEQFEEYKERYALGEFE